MDHHHHLDEAHWEAWAHQTEIEGEVLLGFVTGTAAWVAELRGPDAPPVRQVLDVGSGPGVGTCELARLFPDAEVVAVDGSPAMLARAVHRAAAAGLDGRMRTHLAELPDGLDGLPSADLIWASMSLHHVGDEVAALRALRDRLAPGGLLAVAERAEPLRVLPDRLDVGRPGLAERLERAGDEWFHAMRTGLSDSVPSADVPTMVGAAGLTVVATRVDRLRLDPPLSDHARRLVQGHLQRGREMVADHLAEDDRQALDVLIDPDDPRGVMHRPDVFVDASRQILVASGPRRTAEVASGTR